MFILMMNGKHTMKSKLLRALEFIRVTDEDNNLSITNVVMVSMLVKIWVTPALSMHDIALALAALTNYSHKRHVKVKKDGK